MATAAVPFTVTVAFARPASTNPTANALQIAIALSRTLTHNPAKRHQQHLSCCQKDGASRSRSHFESKSKSKLNESELNKSVRGECHASRAYASLSVSRSDSHLRLGSDGVCRNCSYDPNDRVPKCQPDDSYSKFKFDFKFHVHFQRTLEHVRRVCICSLHVHVHVYVCAGRRFGLHVGDRVTSALGARFGRRVPRTWALLARPCTCGRVRARKRREQQGRGGERQRPGRHARGRQRQRQGPGTQVGRDPAGGAACGGGAAVAR
ncbi:hypothetical protein DFH06DRAFT_1227810 [Mycena polygramma]|nr:hypothetical protein DFH06DRAFT_1227810 [Mycena polygramma]